MSTRNRKQEPKLLSTTNYDLFEVHEYNRDFRPDPQLAESMRKHGFSPWCAIAVKPLPGGKLKILKGHHRFLEAKRQRLPVWYIVDNSTKITLAELEGSSHERWSGYDFATAYRKAGITPYDTLLRFKEDYGLSTGTAAQLCGGVSSASNNEMKKVKAGTFKVGEMKHAWEVVRITGLCGELSIPFATSTGFVAAVSMACLVPEFDQDAFMGKLRLYPRMMNRRSTRQEYLEEIESLYNYKARDLRMPVAFRAREEMRLRNPVGKKGA